MTDYLDVTHIALEVHADLREAESYYCELFDLQLSWREPVPPDAPFDLPWDQVEAAGMQPEIVLLASGAFRLSIESSAAPRLDGRVSHIGLQVTVDQLRRVSVRARQRQYRVINERNDEIFDFVDRYGMEWELDTRSFANPRLIVEQKRERERSLTGTCYEMGLHARRIVSAVYRFASLRQRIPDSLESEVREIAHVRRGELIDALFTIWWICGRGFCGSSLSLMHKIILPLLMPAPI